MSQPCPIDILNRCGARSHHAADGTWLIIVDRRERRPSVEWAIDQLEKSAGKTACVLWIKVPNLATSPAVPAAQGPRAGQLGRNLAGERPTL